eukprot:10691744-Alexandrium_andersonii.AAC.1
MEARFCTGQRCKRWNVPSAAGHASYVFAHEQPASTAMCIMPLRASARAPNDHDRQQVCSHECKLASACNCVQPEPATNMMQPVAACQKACAACINVQPLMHTTMQH